MNRYLVAAILLAVAAVLALGVQAAPLPKVLICHIPPGNPGNAHTIEVSANAIPAHIGPRGHALDYLGACQAPQQPITCEQAVGGGLLTAQITGGNAVVQNTAGQPFNVSLVAYKMYSANTFDQTIFDSETKAAAANANTTYSVDVPACAYQVEVVCGQPRQPPEYDPFQVINFSFASAPYCNLTDGSSGPGVNATLAIEPFYPQGPDYSFLCTAHGFTATKYNWYYGDGQFLFNTTQNPVFHTYAPGNYHVACTASNGSVWATDTMDISVGAPG